MDNMIQWIFILLVGFLVIRRLIPGKGISNITIEETKDKFKDNNVQFIDVRTPGEYKAFHQKPFRNIPLNQLASQVDKLDKEKEVVVICQSGMRSANAAKMLKKQGFQKIYNVKGGMSSWN